MRIHEITSNVQVTGGQSSLSEEEISRIVTIVLERVREEQDHQNRISEEMMVRDRASEVEPY